MTASNLDIRALGFDGLFIFRVFLVGPFLVAVYGILKGVYNVWLHPLSRYPGPIIARATKVPVAVESWNGTLSQWLKSLHDYYDSEIVRFSPDEVSIISASAWKDIHGPRVGLPKFEKDMLIFASIDNIVTASDADHSRIRRLLSHAFSDKALREQETLIMTHVNRLLECLKRQSDSTQITNLGDWFMWFAFDVIGDLSFGESFGCLSGTKYHHWVSCLMSMIKSVSLISVTYRFPPLQKLLFLYVPKQVMLDRQEHERLSTDRIDRRLNAESARPDFLSYLSKHAEDREKGGLTRKEIYDNSTAFINAGAETTAAALTAAIWFLGQNPSCLAKAREELHQSVETIDDLTIARVAELKYFNAVVEETLRVYPPAIAGQARVVSKGGAVVSGNYIPEDTGVIINQYAANHSSRNFKDPESFIPERWLSDEKFASDKGEASQAFSIGARNCIGKNLAMAEIRLILAGVLWTFDIDMTDERNEDWTRQKGWFTWERRPLYVKLYERNVGEL